MTRKEFLQTLGLGAAALTVETLPGASLLQASETKKNPLPKNSERLAFGLPDQEAKVNKPVTAIVIGAGARGSVYAAYSEQYAKSLKIVGVADPNPIRREQMANAYGITPEHQFADWADVFKLAKFADAVIIATPDNLHYQPCMRALAAGYDVLLEKPIAQTAKECTDILRQARKYGRIVGVCHVLRYAPYFRALKRVIDEGRLGDIVSVQHFEPVRFHHMAHSYVRGNWYSAEKTTPIIIAKACHDLDIIRWLLNKPCKKVSAFGSLSFYTRKNEPQGAADRCFDCAVEKQCPFSALKIYIREHKYLYVFDALPKEKAAKDAKIAEYLRTTNYGRCVFRCPNDQCDHYVCNLEFEGVNGTAPTTAGLQVEALTSYGGRKTRIMGTKADIVGDMKTFTLTDFLTGRKYIWDEDISKLPGYEGHAGGDWGIVKDFVLAVANQDEKYLSSTIDVSVESHVMGFKAEEARLKNKIVKI